MSTTIFIITVLFIVTVACRGEARWSSGRFWIGCLSLAAGTVALCEISNQAFAQSAPPAGSAASPDAAPGASLASTITAESELDAPASPPSSAEVKVVIPPGRPEWVESAPNLDGPEYRMSVSSGPHSRKRECDRALDEEIETAVSEFINHYLESSAASTMVRFQLKEIKQRFIKPSSYYYETIQVSFGPMYQGHAFLEFDESFVREIEDRWERIGAVRRLLQAGLGSLGVLAFLGLVFGYFRMDLATKGYYTRRLQFVAVAAILSLVAVGIVTGRRFSDLLLCFL